VPHPFFHIVVNNTDITFSKAELDLLKKGPKYNLHTRNKHSLTLLALQAKTAINMLPASDRDFHRKQVSDHLTKMKSQLHTLTSPAHYSEYRTLCSIKSKLNENNATITLADKGNSLVILPTLQYNTKIQNFIDSNNFQTSPTNPTLNYLKQIRNTIYRNTILIPKYHRWRLINLNPSTPTIKLHKAVQPIRSVVNWRNAPAYKLARHFTCKISQLAPLPNTFNIKNFTDLIHELHCTPHNPNLHICIP
jgi:hypothetical protein